MKMKPTDEMWNCAMVTHDADKKPVVGKILQSRGLDVGFETMQLYPVPVINKDVFLLGDGKMRMVVQEAGMRINIG